MTLHDLTPEQRALIELLRKIGYGSLTNLAVRDGQPVLDGQVKAHRRLRIGRCDEDGGPPRPDDFVLKKAYLDLLAKLLALKNGRITVLQVQDGLPVHLELEESVQP